MVTFDLTPRENVKIGIDLQDYCSVARELKTDVATIRCVDAVESAGSGFLPSKRPKILFEGHYFYSLANRYGKAEVVRREAPSICYPKWTKIYYVGREGEFRRLERAIALCIKHGIPIECALKAASWGRFQVMGDNAKKCGYSSVIEFVEAMYQDEDNHLEAFVRYVTYANLDDELRAHKWDLFAYGYNGAGYRRNNYHIKLPNAYKSFARIKVDCNKLQRAEVAKFFPAERNPMSELIEEGVTHTSLDDRYSTPEEAALVSVPAEFISDNASESSDIPPNSSEPTVSEPPSSDPAAQQPAGDAPDAEPKAWLSVEDWKPFVRKWLMRAWGFFTGANFTQISSLGFAGFNDPANWWLYIGAALFILFILFVLVALVSAVLLGVWYFNRREINKAHEKVADSVNDPGKYNLGLIVKTVGAVAAPKKLVFSEAKDS